MKAWQVVLKEMGYFHEQSTKPQTLGYGLSDSPVGLLAWIVEKFNTWGDCNGNIESRFSKDELLTNVMIYWVTNTITSSTRFYYEFMQSPNDLFTKVKQIYISVPTAWAVFPKELLSPPISWVPYYYNLTRVSYLPSGGHFAALEEPVLLSKDIQDFYLELSKTSSSKRKSQNKAEL